VLSLENYQSIAVNATLEKWQRAKQGVKTANGGIDSAEVVSFRAAEFYSRKVHHSVFNAASRAEI